MAAATDRATLGGGEQAGRGARAVAVGVDGGGGFGGLRRATF